MQAHGRRGRRLLGVAACAIALLGGGCGSGEEPSDDATDGAGEGIPADVRSELRALLVGEQALTDSEAGCAIRRLEGELDEPPELDPAGELPPATVQAAFEAGVACAGR